MKDENDSDSGVKIAQKTINSKFFPSKIFMVLTHTYC